jgi:hypothetical protein
VSGVSDEAPLSVEALGQPLDKTIYRANERRHLIWDSSHWKRSQS